MVRTEEAWQKATNLKYASSSRSNELTDGVVVGEMTARGERVHGRTMSLVRWSNAAYGDQSAKGKYPLGYIIRRAPSSPAGPRHVLQRTSRFTRKVVTRSLGGAAYALSEMVGHMSLIRDLYKSFEALSPGMIGSED